MILGFVFQEMFVFVIVVFYDVLWLSKFEFEKQVFFFVLVLWLVGFIEYVGSIVVFGFVVKFVIDIMVVVESLDVLCFVILVVEVLGYLYWLYKVDVMYWFCKFLDVYWMYYFYLVLYGSEFWWVRLWFCDVL